MAPLRVSTTKSEWLPDDPTAFVPTRLWKLPFITTWDDSRNQNRPTDSAEEAQIYTAPPASPPGTRIMRIPARQTSAWPHLPVPRALDNCAPLGDLLRQPHLLSRVFQLS